MGTRRVGSCSGYTEIAHSTCNHPRCIDGCTQSLQANFCSCSCALTTKIIAACAYSTVALVSFSLKTSRDHCKGQRCNISLQQKHKAYRIVRGSNRGEPHNTACGGYHGNGIGPSRTTRIWGWLPTMQCNKPVYRYVVYSSLFAVSYRSSAIKHLLKEDSWPMLWLREKSV